MRNGLLSRDEFREGVFARDKNLCVICHARAQDAHHIIERRLFDDGGYYLNNGASLCGEHHLQAETTDLSCGEIRSAAGIKEIVLPPDYYPDHEYTKWGDIVLNNGQRMKGPVFFDESVQKILKQGNNYSNYTDYIKYPRSLHLPWSEGKTKDDRTLDNCNHFNEKEVIVLEKLDGENLSYYRNGYHARSIDGRDHWSRSYAKNLQVRIAHEIPEGWRLCGENLYAKHSIHYTNLRDYVYFFSIWNERNVCLSWDETAAYLEILGLHHPKIMYRGQWDENKIKNLYTDDMRDVCEGYVVRLADSFAYGAFSKSLAKFVRKEHVGTSHHWFFIATEKNILENS